jgi:hypothetical protein
VKVKKELAYGAASALLRLASLALIALHGLQRLSLGEKLDMGFIVWQVGQYLTVFLQFLHNTA